MAKKLGIDVEIKYPSKTAILDGMKKAWGTAKPEFEAKVNISPDKNSLSKMKTSIQKFLDSYNFDFKLRLDTTQAMKDMRELRNDFNQLRNLAEEGIDVKFIGASEANKDFKEINKSIKDTSDSTKRLEKENMSQQSRLKDIAGMYKEIGSLQVKSAGAGAKEQAVYNKRIEELQVQLKLAKNEYKDIFGASSDNDWMIQNVKRVGEFNIELKQSQMQQKEINEQVKEYKSLLNEEFKIQKELQKAGDKQSQVLEEQMDKVRQKQGYLLKEEGLLENMTIEQGRALNAITQQNEYQLKLTQAKREDADLAKRQTEAYKDLKTDMNEIYKIQTKVNELQAKQDHGVITAREEETLNSLQMQLIVRKDMHDTNMEIAKSEGLITKEAEDNLATLSRQHQEKAQLAEENARMNADLKVTTNLYDEIEDSVKRVQSLTKDLAKAGSREADIIREAIRAEEDKQQEIYETLRAQERVNDAREEEIATMKRVNREQEELNSERASARQSDTYRENSIIGMLDPMTVYNEGKQVAMAVYDVVAELDKQIVDIEKVADASEEEMNRFKKNVFDLASDVGVSADIYSSSVERWLTQGFVLDDAMNLARESTMGSFVGNINEEAMVDYMSVPLLAYKDAGLEVSDVLNSMNEVANNNAIEMDDLGKAYQRSANTASTTGTSFAELTAMVTAAQEATRLGGDTIGTSMRAIDMNFSKMGSGITKADVERTAFFKNIGVDVVDANGNLNSTFEIIEQLEGVWGNLNSNEQSTASFYAGGKMHAQTLQGIIKQWDTVEKVTGEVNGEMELMDKTTGSAYREFEAMQGSVEFAVAGLKNAWSELIHEISGGRDGVTMVVEGLTKLVELGTKIVQNERAMGILKGMLKATLWITAHTAMKKVFTLLKGSLLDTASTAKETFGFISGIFGKGAVVAEGAKTASTVGKVAGAFGGLKLVVAKLVPVIGLAVGAMALLDILGVDIIGTFKSMADGTFGLNKAIKEYQETHEATSKSINENSLINREFDNVNDLIKKYKDLNGEKEKAFEKRNTDGNPDNDQSVKYTKEEFGEFKESFDKQAKDLDIDLSIKFNDYEHIKSQLEELERQKNLLEKDSAKELVSDLRTADTLPTNQSAYEDDFERINKHYTGMLHSSIQYNNQEMIAEYENVLNEYSRTSKAFTDLLFNEQNFKEAKKIREEMVVESKDTRDKLVEIHDTLNPSDLGKEDSLFVAQQLLPSISEMTTEINALENVGSIIEKNGRITEEQASYLIAKMPELAGVFTDAGLEIEHWSDDEIAMVKKSIEGQKELTTETSKSVETRIRALMRYTEKFTPEQIDEYIANMKGSHQEMIESLSNLGNTGALAVGVTEEALAMYGDQWSDVMIRMQNDIDKLPEDVKTEYNLVTDDGFFNWELIETVTSLPENLVTKYELVDDEGIPNLENIVKLFDEIPAEKKSELKILDSLGNIDISKLNDQLSELPEEEIVKIFMDDIEFKSAQKSIMRKIQEVDEETPTPTLALNPYPFNEEMVLADGKMRDLDGDSANPEVDADDAPFVQTTANILESLGGLDNSKATPTAHLNTDAFEEANKKLDEEVNRPRTIGVRIQAWRDEKTWSNFGKIFTGGSVGIGGNASTGIGSALSLGTSASVGTSASTSTRSKGNNPRYSDDRPPAKVDQEVWRYWAKELYKGLPLENSMDKLNNSLKNASEDNKKLIALYKEQNKLTKEQVAYEKDMKSAQQSEMNSILSQLRKEGFKTSGNRVTNLGIAKNMSGDKAERTSELLNRYNSVYKALDSTNDNIRKLNQDIADNNKTIKDTEEAERQRLIEEATEKELKALEKHAKRAEGLLTNIANDISIFSTKLGLVSDSDFELKLSVTEEGINKSSGNITKLINEFNKLSKISVEYDDNVDTLKSQLEGLKSEIIDNADSILAYRDAMKELEISRMADDFDKFANRLESNLGRISNNIDNVKDGLLSGQSLSSLTSSSLMGLDFNRKTKLERDFEQRLNLERELNEALDAFAKKNVDRVKGVANATLTVEQSKYRELLKLANGYSNGKVESVSINTPTKSIGAVKADTSKDGSYQKWTNELVAINNDYVKAYSSMVSKYDNAMRKAKTASEKELLTNSMIIDQLKLQEEIYASMLTANNKAIKNTEDMLKDSSLTTDQRQDLLETIETYRQSNIDAQNSIKDSVKSRFDLEFELIDEATERTQQYTEDLSHIMSIAEAVGSGNGVVGEIYRAMYQSKINEYASATEIIKDLAKQQSKFGEGSYEWNILQEKIADTQSSLSQLTLEILNANKDVLDSQLDIIQEANEKMTLGSSAEEYDRRISNWISGVEKELELEDLRLKLSGLEDKRLLKEIELMDRQEKVSKAELEYVNKQLEAVRLEEKLENLRGERNVQTLAKDSNGNWQWQYVADQSEYDSTKQELNDVRLEIEKYREEQRRDYVNEMNDIIGRVRDGSFGNITELEVAIDSVHEMFDGILKDVGDVSLYDTASIIKAYQDYIANNEDVFSDTKDGGYSQRIAEMGTSFEQAFMSVATDLGELIADELKSALNAIPLEGKGNSIVIERQVLEFPNITDANGLEDAIRDLPQVAKQISLGK